MTTKTNDITYRSHTNTSLLRKEIKRETERLEGILSRAESNARCGFADDSDVELATAAEKLRTMAKRIEAFRRGALVL